jgi:hypothetical protein
VRTIKHVLTRVLQCATSLMVVHWSGTAPGAQGGRSVESVARWQVWARACVAGWRTEVSSGACAGAEGSRGAGVVRYKV